MWMMACSKPKHALRRSLIALTLGGLIGGGCNCGDDGMVTDSTMQAVRVTGFAFPANSSTVTSQDDISSAEGIQVNVLVDVDNGDTETFNLFNNVDVDSSGAPRAATAVAEGGQVVFAGYTLPEGDAIDLVVALEGQTCNVDNAGTNDACATVRIRVVQSFCQFFSPTRDQILTEDQYPGDASDIADPLETDVLVDCAGIEDIDNVALQVNGGVPIVAQPAPGQTTVFKRVTFSRVALAEGDNSLTVTPRTDANGANGVGTPETITVSVDTGRCVVTIEPVDGSRILFDSDGDQNPENGMQATIDVTTDCADTSTVALFIRGPMQSEFEPLTPNEPATTSAVLEGTEFRFPSVTLPESTMPFDITVLATVTEPDGGRDGAALPANYWVDSLVPAIDSVSPGPADCFGVSRDVDPEMAGIQVNGEGATDGAQDGSEVWVRAFTEASPTAECTAATEETDCASNESCREGLCRLVTTTTANIFSFVGLTLPDGLPTIEYIALDAAGNRSLPLEVQVQSAELGPQVEILAPMAGPIGPSADLNTGEPGIQLVGQVRITNPETATAGSFSVSGEAVPLDPANAIDGVLNVTLSLDNGPRTLIASVADECGDPVTASIQVDVRSDAPEISVTAYEVGGFDARNAVFNRRATASSTLDLDIGIGESMEQRTVDVTLSPTFDGMACGAGNSVSSQMVDPGTNGVLVNVSLLAGLNCFTVQSTDSFGTVSQTYIVNQVNAAPTISFLETSPYAPVDANADTDFDAPFTINFSEALAAKGVLTLTVGASATTPYAVYEADVAAGLDTFAFGGVSVPGGMYDVTAAFMDEVGNSSNVATLAEVQIPSDIDGFAIVSPREGEIVAPAAGEVTVQLEQLVAFSGTCELTANDGSPVAVTFAAGEASVTVAVATGPVNLEATCDVGGNVGVSNDVSFFALGDPAAPSLVDESAGTAGALVYSMPPVFANLDTLDQSQAAGFQRDVFVEVPTQSARPVGWTVTLTINGADSTERVFTRSVETGSAPTTSVLFPAVDFGVGDGEATITVAVTDSLSRTTASGQTTVTVDRTAPTLVQLTPPPKLDPTEVTVFTRDDDEIPDLTTVEISFDYTADNGQEVQLTITPAPNGVDPELVRMVTATGGVASFLEIPFVDGEGYSARAVAIDEAGNSAVVQFENFNVLSLTPESDFFFPRPPRTLSAADDESPAAEFQLAFLTNTVGFDSGSAVRICSTVQAPGTAGTPCTFGFPGGFNPGANNEVEGGVVGGTVLQGFVVATGSTTGSFANGSFFATSVTLGQGEQWLHFEVEDQDLDPQVASPFLRFTVDSSLPSVAAVTFTDDDDGLQTELDATDGSVDVGRLLTMLQVTVTGVEDDQPISVISNLGGQQNVVGSSTVTGGTAMVPLSLLGGAQLLTVRVTDLAGNENDAVNDPAGVSSVVVDFNAPTLGVPEPSLAIYSTLNGNLDDGGTPTNTADDRLLLDAAVAVTASVSDDVGLGSPDCTPASGPVRSCLTLQAWDSAARNGTLNGEIVVPLSAGVTSVPATALPLAQGANHLRGILTDSVGNETIVDPTNPYVADLRGPALALQFSNGGAAQTCADFASAATTECTAVMTGSGTRQWFDPQDDLEFTVSECTLGGESCDLTLRLESRVVDATNMGGPTDMRPYSPVSGSSFAISDNIGSFSSVTAVTTMPLFDAGQVREVRLVTTDVNGNPSVSNSVFLTLGIDGVIIEVERLAADGMTLTGDTLEDGTIYGIDDNTSGATNFTTNFRVRVTQTAQVPSQVTLDNGASIGPVAVMEMPPGSGIFIADFIGVALADSPAAGPDVLNVLTVDVDCGAVLGCGERIYSDIVVDIDQPFFSFDRCSLCNFDVTFSGDVCAQCPGTNDELETALGDVDLLQIVDQGTATATWNIALDKDNDPSNGFSTSAAEPIRVIVEDVQEAPRVEMRSSQGTLLGSELLASGCTGGVCTATFENLSVPTLANGLLHDITVSFVDRAGNTARAEPGLAGPTDETLFAVTDVTRPSSVAPTVCLGESTTPTVIVDPATDPVSFDDPVVCADEGSGGVCTDMSCDRGSGNVALAFNAPADDGDTGDRVVSYNVHAVPRGIEVSGTTFTSCDDVTIAGPFEQSLSLAATVDPGAQEVTNFTGLNLSRSYCFLVEAVDDVGNGSVIDSFARERVIPWLTDVPGQTDVGAIVAFDPLDPDYSQSEAYVFQDTTSGSNLPVLVTALGDMDGDSRDELAVARTLPAGAPQVWLFFSTDNDLSTPSVIIDPPVTANTSFAQAVVSGDIDNDGLHDLVITSPGKDDGAVYLWWGTTGVGIRRDLRVNPSDPDLPSINPDVWFEGAGGDIEFGFDAVVADFDGVSGAELAFSSFNVNQSTVWGYPGTDGTRDRYGWTSPTDPPVRLVVEATLYQGNMGENQGRPDFRINPRPNGGAEYFLDAGDFDGDGDAELFVADEAATHAPLLASGNPSRCTQCGEFYIYDGLTTGIDYTPVADGTTGQVLPSGALTSVHRYRDRVGGNDLWGRSRTILQNMNNEGRDWLVVQHFRIRAAVVFRGSVSGLVPANQPPGGALAADYEEIVPSSTLGVGDSFFGVRSCTRTGATGFEDVLFTAFGDASDTIGLFRYVFDPMTDEFTSESVIPGRLLLGTDCSPLGTYLGPNQDGYLVGIGASQGAAIVIR